MERVPATSAVEVFDLESSSPWSKLDGTKTMILMIGVGYRLMIVHLKHDLQELISESWETKKSHSERL
jgi:hypothetical protein